MGKITINVSLNWKESKMTEKIIARYVGSIALMKTTILRNALCAAG